MPAALDNANLRDVYIFLFCRTVRCRTVPVLSVATPTIHSVAIIKAVRRCRQFCLASHENLVWRKERRVMDPTGTLLT